MFPFIEIGHVHLPTYGFLLFIGVALAMFLAAVRTSRYGLDKNSAINATLFGLVGMMIGAKLLYLIPQIPQMWAMRGLLFSDPQLFTDYFFSGGLVFYGSLIGAAVMLYIFCKTFKFPILPLLDVYAPCLPLAQAIGRLGCFMVGCCYGVPTDGPFGIVFHASPVAPNGIALFPVQLAESALTLLMSGVLFWISRKPTKPGLLIGLYMLMYGMARFALEYLRFDEARGFILGISTSQFISIFIIAAGIFMCLYKFKQQKPPVEV